jgi:hypothetical protein
MESKELITAERKNRIENLLGSDKKKENFSKEELEVFDCIEAVEAYVALALSDWKEGEDFTENQEAALERLGDMTSPMVAVDVVDKYL